MSDSLSFKIKNNVADDKHLLIEMFFKNWVDESCDNQVHYNKEHTFKEVWFPNLLPEHEEILNVHFDRREDAVALRLRGIPDEFKKYLEIINKNP